MPMFRSWMSPGNSVLRLCIEEHIAYTKTIITAKLQQALAIFIHLPNAKMTKTRGPRVVISTNSSVKVSENEQRLSLKDFFDSSQDSVAWKNTPNGIMCCVDTQDVPSQLNLTYSV